MNASLIVSVTATVLCVAVTVAVYFAMSGDENASQYHYRVSFDTSNWAESDGVSYGSGSGTIVVNKGVQSFSYTYGGVTHWQEEDGMTFHSDDGGANVMCVGDVGGLDYASATPQAVAGSLEELENLSVEGGAPLICDAGDKVWSVEAFDTTFFICSDADGTPKSVSGTNFKASVTSFEMDENTPFDPVTVPDSATVEMEFCTDKTEDLEICAIDTADMLGPTFETSAACCSALGSYVRKEVDGDTVTGCDKFEACYGGCHSFTANFIDKMEVDAEIAGARASFDAWCAADSVEDLVADCAASRRLDAAPHWRDVKKIKVDKDSFQKANHKKAGMSTEELNDRRALREEANERIERLNRARFMEEHGEDYERHLTEKHGEETFREMATQVRACFMHGMGCSDSCNDGHYWGDLAKYLPSGSEVFVVNTDSKYCDYKSSGGPCQGAAAPGVMINGQWHINTNRGKSSRGSLPNQYKRFIDENKCNYIVAHSMGNPTMHEVWTSSGKQDKYRWMDSNGPMRGSTAAQVVWEYCNQGFWDYFSWNGITNALMYGVSSAMGYCGTGDAAHNALLSMRPHGTNTWRTGRGNCLPLVGGGPNCPDSRTGCGLSDTIGCGAHYVRGSEREHWFEMKSVNHEKRCSGWAWFGCVGRTLVAIVTFQWVCQQDALCEDSGDFKGSGGGFHNHGGMLGAMCGDGAGYGLGSGFESWLGVGSGGDLQNVGLWLIHKVADYGEGSDGMVSYSSCRVPGRGFSNSYTGKFYRSDQSHLDGTCYSGDGNTSFKKPCSWIGHHAGNGGGCNKSAHLYERLGYCHNYWRGYCSWHWWVQRVCPCTC
jgi:hypothetical protein